MTGPQSEPDRHVGAPPSPLPVPARLVEQVAGPGSGARLLDLIELPPALAAGPPSADRSPGSVHGGEGPVSRADVAIAVALVLFDDLLQRVPSAAEYTAERRESGRRVRLDHGAVRTIDWPSGGLPRGQEAVARLLRPLGYVERDQYDLAALRMTGHSWAHADDPESIPQWFVSELHVDRCSFEVQAVVAGLVAKTEDPLDPRDRSRLERLERFGTLPFDDAALVVAAIARCFARHHPEPTDQDYDLLVGESAELAWIATEGTTCNHWTDRVADVEAAARVELAAGRPIKDTIEVSASGRVRQTAHRAAMVLRRFATVDGEPVFREVPGSFFELIERSPLPDGSGLDLAFDAANATGIFAMTRPEDHDQAVAGKGPAR